MAKSYKSSIVLAAMLGSMFLPAAHAEPLRFAQGDAVKPVSAWVYREDAPEPGKFVTADLSGGFAPFDGVRISSDPSLQAHMYTFRFDFVPDESTDGFPLALFVGPGDYPRDVYLNGVQLIRTGDHGSRYAATIYYSARVLLPPELLKYGETNRVAVEGFPKAERGGPGEFALGGYYDVTRKVFLRNFFNINFIQAATLISLFMAFFFFALFLGSGRTDRRYIWFALLCLSFSLSYSNMSLWDDASNDVALDQISRIGLPFTSLFLAFFSMRFTGVLDRVKWLKPAMTVPAAVCIPVTLAQTTKLGVATAFANYTTNFVLMPLLIFILVVLVIGFIREKTPPRFLVLLGYFAVIAASVHDILYVTFHMIPYCYLVAYGYLAMLIAIFFVLSIEQSRISVQLAVQTVELNSRNASLKEMVNELTAVSEGLVSSSAVLEKTLGDTLTVVERQEAESRDILDAFGVQMKKIEGEITAIADRLALSSERVPKAIDGQTRAVEDVNRILAEMDERVDGTLRSASDSNATAGDLARKAEESSVVIRESRASITRVSEYSGLLKEVLGTIEDISERTHILSINAAIESAKFGAAGKGFGVVAQEIRSLADLSRQSLQSSFEKIGEMTKAVAASSDLSEKVSRTLTEIVGRARDTAESTTTIRALIEHQHELSAAIMKNAADLLDEAHTLKELSLEERELNDGRKDQFLAMKDALASISRQLESQDEKKREMAAELGRMRIVMEENTKHIALLKRSIDKAQVA